MDIQALLKEMVERNGSDLYITTQSPPLVRSEGENHPIGTQCCDAADTAALANALMTDAERETFSTSLEMNLGIDIEDVGRFRVNVHRQRESVGIVARHVKTKINQKFKPFK